MNDRQEKRVKEVLQLLEVTSREVRDIIILKAEQGDFVSLSEIESIACDIRDLRHGAKGTLTEFGIEVLKQKLHKGSG